MKEMTSVPDRPVKTVSRQVQDRLLELVLNGRLEPGSWVRESEFAGLLGVSRTPVREAVRALTEQGLLEIIPNRGARVRELAPEDVRNVYGLRLVLEGYAAGEAALRRSEHDLKALRQRLLEIDALPPGDIVGHIRADEAFHEEIVVVAGNPLLTEFARSLALRVMRLKLITSDTNASGRTREDHHEIVASIAEGDATAAANAMQRHVGTYQTVLLDRLTARSAIRSVEGDKGLS